MQKRYQWAAPGDVNAFLGLMLDNVANLLLTVSLLATVFGFPTKFALQNLVPGTAVGVLVGDLLFFWMALSLAKRTGNPNVTAMPLGLDTPSTFGMIFFVLGPAFKFALAKDGLNLPEFEAATYMWHVGMWSIVYSGIFKFGCAIGSGWIRAVVPRAGLLGSLAAIALVLISFLPLLDIFQLPIVGLVDLAIVLTTLVANVPLPFRLPGMLGALLVSGAIYYIMLGTGTLGYTPETPPFHPHEGLLPTGWFSVFDFQWLARWRDALHYLPLVIPFALATVVGGIDCTESAAAAGDEYHTGKVIAVEAFATLVAGCCGGVIQTTPYIGQPAYKQMGARAAYVLATALFIGGAGTIGYFAYLYAVLPKAAVFPILIFVGVEITAQTFHATPRKHYAAVVLACMPAMASLALIFLDGLQGQYAFQVGQLNANIALLEKSASDERIDLPPAIAQQLTQVKTNGQTLEKMAGNQATGTIGEPFDPVGKNLQTIRMLANGFLITSLLWASALAAIIDRRLHLAAAYLAIAAICAYFSVIHSPMPGGPLVVPWNLPTNVPHSAAGQTPTYMALAYLATAATLLVWHLWLWASGNVTVEAAKHGDQT
jgi:AGZA family xanthine/uracil permease-like MFS transporter